MDARMRIREYIIGRFPGTTERKLSDEDSLLESGVIDSLGILDLVAFIENDLGVAVEDNELTPEYFDSVSSLVRLVERKVVTCSKEERKT